MSDARPLLETGSETERALLAAGVAERPDIASVRTAAKMVGVFPKAALVALGFLVVLRAARWTSVAAWSSLPVAAVATLALVAYESGFRPSAGSPLPGPPARPVLAASAALLPQPASAPVLQPVVPTVEFNQLPAAPARPRARPAPRSSPASSPASAAVAASAPATTESLREQSALLDRARALIASGDARSSVALLDTYDRRFGGKALSEEALLLRIEALAQRGERSSALALAEQFARAHPASVHRERVTAWIHSLAQ